MTRRKLSNGHILNHIRKDVQRWSPVDHQVLHVVREQLFVILKEYAKQICRWEELF